MNDNLIVGIFLLLLFGLTIYIIAKPLLLNAEKPAPKTVSEKKEEPKLKTSYTSPEPRKPSEEKPKNDNNKEEKNKFSGRFVGDSEDAVVLLTNNSRFKGWVCPRCHTENMNTKICGVCGLKKGEGY